MSNGIKLKISRLRKSAWKSNDEKTKKAIDSLENLDLAESDRDRILQGLSGHEFIDHKEMVNEKN
ncbi:MAG: hypothetical protein COV70_00845 [Parcubacteria group bacterium CG11_big_fil_rev_8_21_14_0_20_39_22]|nr:MAG: hypothetical protein COV70_00845 [Parcubacteria group bacterium CG11_big_fil_rev_8_21_14_0_20_39_22]